MSKVQTFEVYDELLRPVTGLSFAFTDAGCFFGTRLSVARSPPAVTEPGGAGAYQFHPSDADEAVGCVAILSMPAGRIPAVICRVVCLDTQPFIALIFVNPDGSFSTGPDVPTMSEWTDLAQVASLPVPPITGINIGTGEKPVFVFTPSPTDVTAGREYLVTAVDGQYPGSYDGNIQAISLAPTDPNAPVVTLISAPSAPIDSARFTVTDDILLKRVTLIAKFSARNQREAFWESVHDGDGFAPGYESSSRMAIPGGFDYIVTRRSGWPGGTMKFEVIAGDTAGNEA